MLFILNENVIHLCFISQKESEVLLQFSIDCINELFSIQIGRASGLVSMDNESQILSHFSSFNGLDD